MKNVITALSVVFCVVVQAAPVVSDVSVVQDADSKLVTVSYSLSEPAVVTMSVSENGAPVGGQAASNAFGDMFRRVEAGSRKAFWQPRDSYQNKSVESSGVKIVVKAWPLDAPPDYMVVDVDVTRKNSVWYYEDAESVPDGVQSLRYKTVSLLLRKIPAANIQWCMGRNASEVDWGDQSDNLLRIERGRLVTLTADYYIGVYEFTQRQWELLSNKTPSTFRGEDFPDFDLYPVSNVAASWIEMANPEANIQPELDKINAVTGLDLKLPTEAQWEYACRAGTSSPFCCGDEWKEVSKYCWHGGGGDPNYTANNSADENGVLRPHVVGSKLPNAWGLHDMHGNVAEYCRDWWKAEATDGTPEIDPERKETDPRDTASGGYYTHVIRGGDYRSSWSQNCRSSYRGESTINSSWYGNGKNCGFRVSCPAVAAKVE